MPSSSKETAVNTEPVKVKGGDSLRDLRQASRALKEKIIEEKKRNDMPLNSSLGNPEADARNADGRNDLPNCDDE
jgi:hypothetical protein